VGTSGMGLISMSKQVYEYNENNSQYHN